MKSIKQAQKGLPALSTGPAKYPIADTITSIKAAIEAADGGDVSSLERDLQLLSAPGIADVDR